ncbi:MAG: hypothetical protein OXC83_04600 [Chloroflexi bacterium]|nr:hypothetical protein [Chloroflexota bacterium]
MTYFRISGFLAALTALSLLPAFAAIACSSGRDGPTTTRTELVNAARVPTVTPSPTHDNPSPTATPTSTATVTPTEIPTATPDPEAPTPEPTSTPLPGPTATAVAEREAYCREHALPTSTPEPDVTPTIVPTSPPGIADDEVPEEWMVKMNEIEDWVLDFYEVDPATVGDFNRRFVADEVWKEWRADAVEDWANDEDSTIDLWEQINRTLTLLSAESDYVEFISDYQGESYIGLYDSTNREIVIRGSEGEFDLEAEIVYVHEYAHYVQNEKYDYVPWGECFEADGDAGSAYRALIEGDASNTQFVYIDEVIGWDRLDEYFDSNVEEEPAPSPEPVMKRYGDEDNRFTYSVGSLFVLRVGWDFECESCGSNREKIDFLFKTPPYTTEQIYHEGKYFKGEGAEKLRLPGDLMGGDWEQRRGSTMGKSRWIALLAALSNVGSDEIEPEHPGWRGDFGLLLEDADGRALHLQAAEWENRRFIESLRRTFNDEPRLKPIQAPQRSGHQPFEELYIWRGDTGAIAMGVMLEPVNRFYTMFLAIGPDLETVEDAVYAARDELETREAIGSIDTGWPD